MILKGSLLNSYSALGNSTSHLALLLALLIVVRYPSELPADSKVSDDCIRIYTVGVITHGLGYVASIPIRWERCAPSVILNVAHTSVLFLNFYLVLIAAKVYIDFAEEDALDMDLLEKLKENAKLSKSDLLIASSTACLNSVFDSK